MNWPSFRSSDFFHILGASLHATNASEVEDYNGGRSYADLQKFAQGLGPMCSPANLDLCDDEKKKMIDE